MPKVNTDQPSFIRNLALHDAKVASGFLPSEDELRARAALDQMGKQLLGELYPGYKREQEAIARHRVFAKNYKVSELSSADDGEESEDNEVPKSYPETIERTEFEKHLEAFEPPLTCG